MTALDTYRARDARISIGLPIMQDNGEFEYPGYVDDHLIGFYATRHHADLALHSVLIAGMDAIIGGDFHAELDCGHAPVGWTE